MKSIFEAGVEQEMPEYLAQKISLSNKLAFLITFGISIPFWVLSLIYFPQIAHLPLLAGVICLLVIPINYMGMTYLSRLVMALLPFGLTAIYSAYLTPVGEPPLSSIFSLQIAFGVIGPFLMFDIREKVWLSCNAIFVLMTLTLFTNKLNMLFELDMVNEVIRTGYLFNATVALSVVTTSGGILYLSYINFIATKNTQNLIDEMDKNNEILQQSQQEMRENIKAIEENQINESKRTWSSQGLAEFSSMLRSNLEGDEMFDKLISGLTQYIKANQGGLYLVNNCDESINIELKSCYAYARKKFTEYSAKPGQGLLGQAYYEKDIIHLTDIPQDYIKITSGLGEALPNSLIIVPLMVNEEIEGFFEFASFKPFEEHEIQFLRDLGETIGSFISVNRINEQTKLLLDETQMQAEQMKAQEEEMLQNLEELQATQEEISRKEREYIKKIKELEGILKEADIELPDDNSFENMTYTM